MNNSISVALLWHMHQPVYRDLTCTEPRGAYLHPWVRLHSLRDYFSIPSLASQHSGIHVTVNVVPCLLWQIEDYTRRLATDRSLELTLKPAERLSEDEQQEVLTTFFSADWHHQVMVHTRYGELLEKRARREQFSIQELRDLQMWFNLAWFGLEFRNEDVLMPDGTHASVHRYVEQGRGFTVSDIDAMVAQQYKVLNNIIPLYRQLQEKGIVEFSVSPFNHPILPLLIDTDTATLDRPGTCLPNRFSWPEDADAQVRLAVEFYRERFGCSPRGMWPSEAAVSEDIVPILKRHGIEWFASDEGVLAKSGKWGYRIEDPNVLCRAYRVESNESVALSVFFRAAIASNAIGFQLGSIRTPNDAAAQFIAILKDQYAKGMDNRCLDDRVITLALDGENAWGSYADDGRPFLHALYSSLSEDSTLKTVTFSEYLDGSIQRRIKTHTQENHERVYELFTGSWIDEPRSAPGVDLGTWIGEDEENRAWNLLGETRKYIADRGLTVDNAPNTFAPLYAAEGSDWFWWFGDDQESGADDQFDELFRMHLRSIYRSLQVEPPPQLYQPIVPKSVVWSFHSPCGEIYEHDRLVIWTNCPGTVSWRLNDGEIFNLDMRKSGGVMAGQSHYSVEIGPLSTGIVTFSFQCHDCPCIAGSFCCEGNEHTVKVMPRNK